MSQTKCPGVRLSGDECGVKGEWMARRAILVNPPPRFTCEEWHLASKLVNEAADSERQQAESTQAEAMRVFDETHEISDQAEQEVQRRFKERLIDVKQWRDELQRKYAEINAELDAQGIYRQRIENTQATLCQVLVNDNDIIAMRECRIGIDLAHDDPHAQLILEIKLVKGLQLTLNRLLAFVNEQMRLLRKAAYNLDKELRDKDTAMDIDAKAQALNIHRSEVRRHCNLCVIDYSNVDELDWEEFTLRNKNNADKCVNASITLRVKVDSLLRQGVEDIQRQLCKTDTVFRAHIKTLVEVKQGFQGQLSEIAIRARELENTICKLTKAYEEKKGAVALAETRISLRGQRPNLELVKDAVQRRLILELHELNVAMSMLNTNILTTRNALKNLLRTQLEVEDAINMKLNTISIDETKVLPLRKTIRIQEY